MRYIFFLFLEENIYYGYSLEVPHKSASNEYPEQVSLRKKKKKQIQLTLVISNSKGLTEILRDIRTSTYQS